MTCIPVKGERGFGLVEAIVGLSLLSVGLLGICLGFAQGMRSISGANFDIVAREKAVEALESVFSSRDTRTITWLEVRNVSGETGNDGGVFLDGPQPLRLTGVDGLVNTADDSSQVEELVQPGPDGLLGNSDDLHHPLTGFTREIKITIVDPANPTLRRIRVVVKYRVGHEERQYELTTFISSYS